MLDRIASLEYAARSTYAAELLGTEEGLDVGILCRGRLAEVKGQRILEENALDEVKLITVVDAKDVFDRGSSDTSSYGSQKSLAFTVAWLRAQLRSPGVDLKWTATSNMFADAGAKDMDVDHLHSILSSCRWSFCFEPKFVKQTAKRKKGTPSTSNEMIGELMSASQPVFNYLRKLSERPGWHFEKNLPIHVARNARALRTPEPRFESSRFPLRSSYGRFDQPSGHSEWRELESRVNMNLLANKHEPIGNEAAVLITIFQSTFGNKI